MSTIAQPYTVGRWMALPGRENELVSAWSEFTAWSLEQMPGAESFVLIRHGEDPRRFISFGAWSDAESVAAWRGSDDFRQRLGRCRALCEQFEGHDYIVVSEQSRR